MRTVATIRHDIVDEREKLANLEAKLRDGSATEANEREFEDVATKLTKLAAELETAQVKEAAAHAERTRLQAIFRGDTPPTPTGDGSLQRKHAPGFAGAILGAGFDLRSKPTVTVALDQAVDMKASVDLSSTTPSTYQPRRIPGIQEMGRDQRFLYPFLPSQGVADETAVQDFRQSGSRTITGSIERAVAATTTKATLDVEIDFITTQLKELAVMMDEIPNQVLRSVNGIEQFLSNEARFALNQALDAHVLAQILAATPPSGLTGADLFAQVRNAIGAMRLLGSNPDLLVLNPTDSATLDLLQNNEGDYYFGGPGRSPNVDTVWGLTVVEHTTTAGTQPPILIDSSRLGTLYLGTLRFEADPFTHFSENMTDLRMEFNALQHVRDASAAYVIEAEE
jgi:hypothetical protein